MFPAWCENYVGIRFVQHGRDRAGFDCWGLTRYVLEAEGGIADLPDYGARYDRVRTPAVAEIFEDELPRHWIRVGDMQAFDIVVFRVRGRPMHVGVVVADGWFISIDQGTDSTLERLDSSRWTGRLEGVYRHVSRC
jgi:probable lipoprotein NlpC